MAILQQLTKVPSFMFCRCLILVIFYSSFSAEGQNGGAKLPDSNRPFYFSHLTRENGLPSDFVMHAIQDFRGYVWIATDNGLARYDGKNMTVFRSHPGQNNSIVDNYVIILKETTDSMLWIGTRNGVSIYDPFKGSFTNYPYDRNGKGKFPCHFIRSFFEDDNGDMWIATNDGLVRSARGSGLFVCHKINNPSVKNEQDAVFNSVTSIVADPLDRTRLFVGTLGGIVLFDKIRWSVIRSFAKVINGRSSVFDMYIDEGQNLWSCGWFTGLNCMNLATGRWKEFPFSKGQPITVLAIYPINRDEFYLSTIGNGLAIFNKITGEYRFIRHDPLRPESILSDNVNHLVFINKTNDLWVIGTDGISVENRKINSFRYVKPPFTFNAITDLYRDKPAGLLFAASYPIGGLFALNEKTGKWSLIPPADPDPSFPFFITLLFKDTRGVLWLGTNRNLMYLDTLTKKIRKFKTSDGKPLDLKDGQITALNEDYTGNLWVGTRSDGVVKIGPSRAFASYYKHRDDFIHSLADGTHNRAIHVDKYNRVWVSNQGGVSIYDPEKDHFNNSFMDTLQAYGYGSRYIYNIVSDSLGRIWMTIDGLGLLRVEMCSNGGHSFRLFETARGLNASSISTLRKDSEGDLWINNISLVLFNPYTEGYKSYDTQNGLHHMMGVGQRVYIDSDLNVYIGEEGGYEVKNKHAMDPSNGVINLVVESVEINGTRQFIGYNRAHSQHFSLTADQSNVTFFFTAICFDNVSGIKYQYKLSGYDRDWNLSENSREARYTNLPPGNYDFQFKVLNQEEREGLENRIFLSISPFFWETWWFILAVLTLVFAIAYVAYHFHVRQLLRVERLRIRIATDLHDDVGSTLSSVSILSEMLSRKASDMQSLKMLKSIGDSSSQMMEKLDDIVWVVNPSNDKFHDLGLRISEYANPLCEMKNIGLDVVFDEKLKEMRLPMEIRRNVYFIAKEAVNNAVKYSDCKNVRMIFKTDHGGLSMEISDNGKGFDPHKPTTRNGLRNMRQRAGQINALIEIRSSDGNGTFIFLRAHPRKKISKTT